MTQEEFLFVFIGQKLNGTVKSQMFGKPCFTYNGKAFICFNQNEMAFKLKGEAYKKAINLRGAQLFDPIANRRPMKEWVQLSYINHDLWSLFAEDALQQVREENS